MFIAAKIVGVTFTISLLGAIVAWQMMRFYVDPEKKHLDPDRGRTFRRSLWPPKIVLNREGLFLWKIRLAMLLVAGVCFVLLGILNPELKWDKKEPNQQPQQQRP